MIGDSDISRGRYRKLGDESDMIVKSPYLYIYIYMYKSLMIKT